MLTLLRCQACDIALRAWHLDVSGNCRLLNPLIWRFWPPSNLAILCKKFVPPLFLHFICFIVRIVDDTRALAMSRFHWACKTSSVTWSLGSAACSVALKQPFIYRQCLRRSLLTCWCWLKLWLHVKWNYFEIISVFYFTCNHVWNWNKIISSAEIISELFQRLLTCWKIFMRCNKLLK